MVFPHTKKLTPDVFFKKGFKLTRKFLVAFSIAALACGWSVGSPAAGDGDGSGPLTIRFAGKIIDTACELSTDMQDETIRLGTFPTQFFRNSRAGVETDAVPFEIIIKRCRLVSGGQKAGYGADGAFPVERVKLTFTDEGASGQKRERNGILSMPAGEGRQAENVGVLVKYKSAGNRFENVFNDAPVRTLSIPKMRYEARGSKNSPEYHFPFRASMASTGTGPVTQGSVHGRMSVTLAYE